MSVFSNNSFSRFLQRFGTSNDRFVSSPFLGHNTLFQPGQETWDSIKGREFDVYETTGILQVILGRKALMKANGMWKHWRIGNDGKIEEVDDSDFIKRLKDPNPLQSGNDFLQEMSIHRDVSGAAYIYGLKGVSFQEVPDALWNILPQLMTIKLTGNVYQQTDINEIIKNFIFDEGGNGEHKYDGDEILFRRKTNVSHPVLPASPLIPLTMEISNARAAMGYRNVILRKRGAIGILSNNAKDADGAIPMKKGERERIEKQYQKNYGISDKQMQVIISNASLLWQPMNYPTKDLMLFEEVDADLRVIIDAYGLNDNMFSQNKGATFENVIQGERIAYQDTIIPESNDDARAFSQFFGLTDDREFLTLEYGHIQSLKDDEVKKSQILERKTRAFQILTMNEGIGIDEALQIVGIEREQVNS